MRMLLLIGLLACVSAAELQEQSPSLVIAPERPATWAQTMKLPGVPNLHVVAPGIYRGAQPTAAGMRELEKLGVKTVINLRAWHDDEDELEGSSLIGEDICFHTRHPEDEDVVRFLSLITDPARQPVFFHCYHGSDRTGMMCAVYRVMECGWSKDEAIKEMTTGGFGYHKMFEDIVEYVEDLDVDAMRGKVILPAAVSGQPSTAPTP
jgi:protein tyrosine/serine phosphatase